MARRSLFSSEIGTPHRQFNSSSLSLPTYLSPIISSDTAISTKDPIIDDRHPSSIASAFNSTTSPSQSRNPPWPFPSNPSPSNLSSPSSYPLPGHSNHPSPADSTHSPPNMIGATPTFYDPELEAQPPTQDYPDWTSTFGQPQLALTTSSSYPHQHSTTDPHPDNQARPPPPQHHDRYQFVNQPPPSTSSDATQFPYFPSFVDSSNSLSQAMRPQGWSAPQSSVYPQASAPNNTYFSLMPQQYPATYDTPQSQHSTQPAEQVPGLAVTPATDSGVSPASANNALPSPGSSHTPTRTALVHPSTKRGSKSTQRNSVRKRPKPESDDDDDDDVLSAGIGTNVPRPNPNRL
jgi:hypothetical protein